MSGSTVGRTYSEKDPNTEDSDESRTGRSRVVCPTGGKGPDSRVNLLVNVFLLPLSVNPVVYLTRTYTPPSPPPPFRPSLLCSPLYSCSPLYLPPPRRGKYPHLRHRSRDGSCDVNSGANQGCLWKFQRGGTGGKKVVLRLRVSLFLDGFRGSVKCLGDPQCELGRLGCRDKSRWCYLVVPRCRCPRVGPQGWPRGFRPSTPTSGTVHVPRVSTNPSERHARPVVRHRHPTSLLTPTLCHSGEGLH